MTLDLYWAASLGKWVTIPDAEPEGGKRFYGDWIIYRDPPPIPTRNCDWHFYHKDFDGAEDAHDPRYGSAASLADAIRQIEDMAA